MKDFEYKKTTFNHIEGVNVGTDSFNLSVQNCTLTEIRMLYAIVKDQLKVETEIIERMRQGDGDAHPLQYGVKEFLSNILIEMDKVDGIGDIGYYLIKGR